MFLRPFGIHIKILKRKKRTDTQYNNKVRFDGQRIGKLKLATWNVREIAEKTEELQTELLKRKIDIFSRYDMLMGYDKIG
jgi:hypothetical protein